MIQKRLDRLSPYFKGLKTTDNYRIVELFLKKTWSVQPKSDDILVQQKDDKGLSYSIFYSEKVSFDEILDYVEGEVINYNLDIEAKERLLKDKVEELKRVFESSSLDELNNLKFTTEGDSLKLGNNVKVVVGTPTNNTPVVNEEV